MEEETIVMAEKGEKLDSRIMTSASSETAAMKPSSVGQKKVEANRPPPTGSPSPPKGGLPKGKGGKQATAKGATPKQPREGLFMNFSVAERIFEPILRSWGINAQFHEEVKAMPNPHVLGAASRVALMQKQCTLSHLKKVKQVVILDPRDGEVQFFHDKFNTLHPNKKVFQRRDELHGVDNAEGRTVVNTDPVAPNTLYVCNDNTYWFTPETMFVQYGFAEHPDFLAGRGVQCSVGLFDFRGEGECLFLQRYDLDEVPAWRELVQRKEYILDPDGKPIMVEEFGVLKPMKRPVYDVVEHPAQRAIDVLEGVIHKSVHGDESWCEYFATSGGLTPGTDTRYKHLWKADAFLDHSEYFFEVDGVVVKMTVHIETKIGYRYLLNVNFSRSRFRGQDVMFDWMPRTAFVEDGRIPIMRVPLREAALTVDRASFAMVNNYQRDAISIRYRILPRKFDDQLAPWAEMLLDARDKTTSEVLWGPQPNWRPREPVVNHVKDAIRVHKSLALSERADIPVAAAQVVVDLSQELTRVGFAVEVALALKKIGVWALEAFVSFLASCRRWFDAVSFARVTLDLASLSARVLGLAATVFTPIARLHGKIEGLIQRWGWLNAYRTSLKEFGERHPILFEAFCIAAELVGVIMRAALEEILKRAWGPIGIIIGFLEGLFDFLLRDSEQPSWIEAVLTARDILLRGVAHMLLTLVPLPFAILVHSLWNWKARGKLESAYERLRNYLFELSLNEYSREDELEPEELRGIQATDIPKDVFVDHLGQRVPLCERPELVQQLNHMQIPVRKTVVLDCPASRQFCRPGGTVLEMALMVRNRLSLKVPKVRFLEYRAKYEVAKEMFFDRFTPREPMSIDEFRVYIKAQGFSANKVKTYEDRLRAAEEGKVTVKEAVVVGKTDEILPIKTGLAGGLKAKMRPIFPIDASDMDFMRFLLTWKQNWREPFVWTAPDGFKYTFTYMLDVRADFLDAWINEHATVDGFHTIALGDDNFSLFVDTARAWCGPTAMAMAYDLAKCDLTCGIAHQTCFTDLMKEGGLPEDAAQAFLTRCKGWRVLSGKVYSEEASGKAKQELKESFKLWWFQDRHSTITGNPATSLQAVFAQVVFNAPAVKRWWEEGTGSPARLAEWIDTYGTECGHILEWEDRHQEWGIKGPPQRCSFPHLRTYLGGIFVYDYDHGCFKWCPHNFLKSCFIFPDTKRIYGGEDHVYKHCAAVSQDSGLLRTPLGGAIADMFKRVAVAQLGSEKDFEFYLEKLHSQLSWYARLKVGKFTLPPVTEFSWLRAMEEFNVASGFGSMMAEYHELIAELKGVEHLPHKLGGTYFNLCYVQRFGAPAGASHAVWAGAAVLDVCSKIGAVFNKFGGSEFIHRVFHKFDSMGLPNANTNNNNNNDNGGPSASPKKPKMPRPTNKDQRDGVYAAQAVVKPASAASPAKRFPYVMGADGAAIRDYIDTIFDCDVNDAGVPNSAGGFELYTQKWRTYNSGTLTIGSSGVGVLGVCASGTIQLGNEEGSPDPLCQQMGWTTPAPAVIRSTDPAAAYTTLPGAGIPAYSAFQGPAMALPDDGFDAETRVRLVAMKLTVRNAQSSYNTEGEALLAMTVNPKGGVEGGSLNSATWDQIWNTNNEVMVKAIKTMKQLEEGTTIVWIPGEAQAFKMQLLPASGNLATYPWFHMGVLVRGGVPGKTLSWDVTYLWESEVEKTYSTNSGVSQTVHVPLESVMQLTGFAKPYAPHANMPNISTLPFVQAMALQKPELVHALETHPKVRPLLLKPPKPVVNDIAVIEHPKTAEKGILHTLKEGGKALVKAAASSGLVSKIPYVGPVLQAAASALSSWFD